MDDATAPADGSSTRWTIDLSGCTSLVSMLSLYYATKESTGHWMMWCCVWCHRCPAHRPIDPSIGTSLLKRSRLCLPLSPLAHAAVVPPCRRVERRPRPCRVRTGGHAVRRPWPWPWPWPGRARARRAHYQSGVRSVPRTSAPSRGLAVVLGSGVPTPDAIASRAQSQM